MKVVVSLLLFFLSLFTAAAQTCKTSIALRVKDVKKSKVDYPTGDKKFLFSMGVPGLSTGGFLVAIIRYFLSI